MQTGKIILSLTIIIMTFSCKNPGSENPGNWSGKKLAGWFQSGEWKCGWAVTPDESIDQKEFADRFFRNRERWEKAFIFLKTNDLKNLRPGRYELEGDSLFVNVDEYTTRNEEDSRFEAHRKYADIQYLVYGEEKIGIAALDSTSESTPYDNVKDIIFLTAGNNNYRIASSDRFFIFFPGDAHRPCVKTNENSKVRKVVVKVRIE